MEGILVLALPNVLVIEQCFSKILDNVSLFRYYARKIPLFRIQKNGIQNSPFKRLINGITCIFLKNWDRSIPHGNLCYKP
jgi:hypothetical protein